MQKRAYTVACPGELATALRNAAAARGCTVADLVRSVLLLLPPAVLAGLPDPGEPAPDDREAVTARTTRADATDGHDQAGHGEAGRPARRTWLRKPRLQVRLPAGFSAAAIRKAAAFALGLGRGQSGLVLHDPAAEHRLAQLQDDLARAQSALARAESAVHALAFTPLPLSVQSREDALHVLGFQPRATPDRAAVRARFRTLAAVHHPDAPFGNHTRMSQLNAAAERLGAR